MWKSHYQRRVRTGFTTTELIVVIGLIILLLAIVLPAFNSVRTQAVMSHSMNNMRQIATFMNAYAAENRDFIVPSQFDYSDEDVFTYSGHVASAPGLPEERRHKGTWADILWTVNGLGVFPQLEELLGHNYSTVAPDADFYNGVGSFNDNPFRSRGMNSRSAVIQEGGLPNPSWPPNVAEYGLPGFFAANDFFNARPDAPDDANGNPPPINGRWYTMGQIRAPERTMYLVDSFVGPVIAPRAEQFDNSQPASSTEPRTIEVDFRYSGNCLMMFMDGSVHPQSRWTTLCDLECWDAAACDCSDPNYSNRGIRITNPIGR